MSGKSAIGEGGRRLMANILDFSIFCEGEATGQLFGRISLTLMKANALMLSTRCQDADFPPPSIDGIE